jgi:hypothetical protein
MSHELHRSERRGRAATPAHKYLKNNEFLGVKTLVSVAGRAYNPLLINHLQRLTHCKPGSGSHNPGTPNLSSTHSGHIGETRVVRGSGDTCTKVKLYLSFVHGIKRCERP